MFKRLVFVFVTMFITTNVSAQDRAKTVTATLTTKKNVQLKVGGEMVRATFKPQKKKVTFSVVTPGNPIGGGDACLTEGEEASYTTDVSGTCKNVAGTEYPCTCKMKHIFMCVGKEQKYQRSEQTNICAATGPATDGGTTPLETQTPTGR